MSVLFLLLPIKSSLLHSLYLTATKLSPNYIHVSYFYFSFVFTDDAVQEKTLHDSTRYAGNERVNYSFSFKKKLITSESIPP